MRDLLSDFNNYAWPSKWRYASETVNDVIMSTLLRLRNDLYCVEWGVKLYSLTHSLWHQLTSASCEFYV